MVVFPLKKPDPYDDAGDLVGVEVEFDAEDLAGVRNGVEREGEHFKWGQCACSGVAGDKQLVEVEGLDPGREVFEFLVNLEADEVADYVQWRVFESFVILVELL